MQRHIPCVLLTVVLALSTAHGNAQGTQPGQVTPATPRTPARAPDPNGTDPIIGKSILRGYVVTADTGAPVRRALVTAVADPRRRGTATTDAEGGFEIRDLPAGRYTLQATKSGFLQPGMEQAGRSFTGPRTPIDLGESSVVEKIMISMWRGGVIAGRVTDEYGEPVAGAQVNAMRYGYQDGRRRMMPARVSGSGGFARTDDLGGFRLFGLPAGEYFVGAQPPRDFSPFGDTGPSEGLATTYFPGSPDVTQARQVRVRAGQEAPNVSFSLVRQRLSRVRGIAMTSKGTPYVGAMVMVSNADSAFMGGMSSGGGVQADGAFTVTGLAPGAYNLIVRAGMPGGDETEMGSTRIIADGTDIDGLLIMASRGATLSGRVMTDDGSPLPATTGLMMVMANAVDREIPMMGPSQVSVKEDGTFEIKGLFGTRTVRSAFRGPGGAGWNLKSVFMGAADVTDEGIDFSSGRNVEGVEIVLTRKVTRISGTVTADGRPAANGAVIIFPADERRWSARSRFMRWIPLRPEGKFETGGLPVHDDYRIVAVPPLEDGQWTDPDFLRSVMNVATRLSLAEGETKVQDLRLMRPESQ